MRLTRRRMLGLGLGMVASVSKACGTGGQRVEMAPKGDDRRGRGEGAHREGVLLARPRPVDTAHPAGEQRLQLGGGRDGLLYVPPGYRRERAAALAVLLHGAGGDARHGLSLLRGFADSAGLILLAPESRRETWDVIVEDYGPDVAFIDRALELTFGRYSIDERRVAFGGFSDGASYALSLGVANGDLATHVIAFSPGFMAPARRQGSPRLFISHGTRDKVLPIDRCSRHIVPQVRRAGYDVRYREFDGPHTVPSEVAREAVDWFSA